MGHLLYHWGLTLGYVKADGTYPETVDIQVVAPSASEAIEAAQRGCYRPVFVSKITRGAGVEQ